MTEHPKFSTKCDQRRQLVVKLQRHLTVPAGQMRDRGRDIGIEKRAIDALGAAAAPHDELADIGEASSLRMIAGAAAAVARRARGEPGALIADTISAGGQLACDASVSSSGQPLTGVPSSRRWGGACGTMINEGNDIAGSTGGGMAALPRHFNANSIGTALPASASLKQLRLDLFEELLAALLQLGGIDGVKLVDRDRELVGDLAPRRPACRPRAVASGRLEHACAGSHFVRRVDNGCRLAGVSAYSDRSDSTGHAPAPGT